MAQAQEIAFKTIEGADALLKSTDQLFIVTVCGVIARCNHDQVALNMGGRSFIELGNSSIDISEEEAKKLKKFLHQVTGKFSWGIE